MVSIWKGSIAFGLVNVPIRLYAATEDHDVTFHQVHRSDGGRIKYRRVCELDGDEVPFADIAKAFTTSSGEDVVLTSEDLDSLPVAGAREIAVSTFVPSDQIDPVWFDKSYFLEPDAAALKPYILLRETLQRCGRTAVVRVALRQRSRVAVLRVCGDVILLQTLHWRDELRHAEFDVLKTPVSLEANELKLAGSLVEAMTSDFSLSDHDDTYRDAMLALLDAKAVQTGGSSRPDGDKTARGDNVVDLMSALQASLAKAQPAAPPATKAGTRRRKTARTA